VSRTVYGYEVRVHAENDNDRHSRCVWSAEAAGQQGPSNYLATEEEAEAGREQLAWALSTNGEEVSVEDVRVVAVEVP
jgi:hypothetical protein